jgi:hypothetical protein
MGARAGEGRTRGRPYGPTCPWIRMGWVAGVTRADRAAGLARPPAFSPGVVLGSSMGRVTGGRWSMPVVQRADEPTVRRPTVPGPRQAFRVGKGSPVFPAVLLRAQEGLVRSVGAPAVPDAAHLTALQAVRQTWGARGAPSRLEPMLTSSAVFGSSTGGATEATEVGGGSFADGRPGRERPDPRQDMEAPVRGTRPHRRR